MAAAPSWRYNRVGFAGPHRALAGALLRLRRRTRRGFVFAALSTGRLASYLGETSFLEVRD